MTADYKWRGLPEYSTLGGLQRQRLTGRRGNVTSFEGMK